MHQIRTLMAALATAAACSPALADDFMLTFDNIPKAGTAAEMGLAGLSEVLGYYNGDPGAAPTFPRAGNQSWGVTFDAGALAIKSAAAGGPGNFATARSGDSALGTLEASSQLTLNAGLSLSGMSLWYDKISGTSPTLQLYSNGSSVFTDTLSFCASVGADGFCGWTEYKLANSVLIDLAAQGKRVTAAVFAAELGTAVFDDVSLSTVAIPEPATYALMAFGLAVITGAARRRHP
jgi:hypothetical protein